MIVMKFGGTSVQDAASIRNVCKIIDSRKDKRPIVVLSACAGITNELVACAELAADGNREEAQDRLEKNVYERHYTIVQELIEDLREQDLLIRHIRQHIDDLSHLLYGISITGDLSPRVLDFALSYGETLSTSITTVALREAKMRSILADSRECIITNSAFGRAEPLLEQTRIACEANLLNHVMEGRIPVLQGFIAANEEGITTTLGRGGSDYTTAIVGSVLHADNIEIWTDVDGILTADPKIVKNARRVQEMSFQEASELAYFGAKVLHPSTLLPAIEKNIPVTILNSKRPEIEGTRITALTARTDSAVKSISYKRGITVVNISSTRMLGSYGFMKKIFDVFDFFRTSVDLVVTSEVSVSLSIESSPDMPGLLRELEQYGTINLQENRAIVCVVGEKIIDERGLAARIFSRLQNVPIDMISQGGSDTNMTFVIHEQYIGEAVSMLHEEFFPA
ncbi:MAG: lysine-sensitive aspartokinase 3 [Ectothiorhodospiraceae bacterium]|nr:lysine-sensitive aspartokinase 3 [Ectothiorhodospiraceae bacterium]